MQKIIPKILSVVFHPFLIPLAALFVLFNSGTYLSLTPIKVQQLLYMLIFTATVVFPLSAIPLLRNLNIWKNESQRELFINIIPYIVIFITYIITIFLLLRLPISLHWNLYMVFFVASALTVIGAFMRFLKKISPYSLATGALIGLILYFSVVFKVNLFIYLVIALLIAGISSYARLALNKDNPKNIYLSFLTGLLVSFAMFYWL